MTIQESDSLKEKLEKLIKRVEKRINEQPDLSPEDIKSILNLIEQNEDSTTKFLGSIIKRKLLLKNE